MMWCKVSEQRYERQLGENEMFIKIVGDLGLPSGREHWAINVIASVTLLGKLAKEDPVSTFREAWKSMRFSHPTIAAYMLNESKFVYDVPDIAALETWATETFHVIENKTADEVIASRTTRVPYAMMTFLPKKGELLAYWQHWRTDGIGALILMDEFLQLAADAPKDPSVLPWGEEVTRLAPCVEEALSSFVTSEEQDKEIGRQNVATFGHATGAVGVASRASSDTSPCGTRINRLHFTEEETRAIVQGCKSRGLSVSAAVHASVAEANYALAAPGGLKRHYTSTIRYSLRPFLPEPYSGRQYASTIFTTGWMFPVSSESSWSDRAIAYHAEYHKGLSLEYLSAHREYAIGLCCLLLDLPENMPSPTDVDISSLGVCERFLAREKGTAERRIRINHVSVSLDMTNRQSMCFVWTFRDQLCLELSSNEAFYDMADMDSFLHIVKTSLFREFVLTM